MESMVKTEEKTEEVTDKEIWTLPFKKDDLEDILKRGKAPGSLERPLYLAAKRGNLEIVKYLVAQGEDINEKGLNGLDGAIARNRFEIVDYLLSQGADINKGYVGLYNATMYGHYKMVKYIIEHGYDLKKRNDDYCPLDMALTMGHTKIIKYLVSQGSDVDRALDRSIVLNYTFLLDYLLSRGADINKCECGLYNAAANNNYPMVKYVIEHGYVLNKGDVRCFPLPAAAIRGNLDIVSYLISKGADVNQGFPKPLCGAASSGYLEVVKCLVDAGATQDGTYSDAPIYWAFQGNHWDVVEFLLLQSDNAIEPLDKAMNEFGRGDWKRFMAMIKGPPTDIKSARELKDYYLSKK